MTATMGEWSAANAKAASATAARPMKAVAGAMRP